MSKPSKRHPQAGDTRSPTFKMRPIAVACSSLMFIAGAAYAAEPVVTGDAAMETVVVTGLRHSIETSIAAKKESDSIVEVITAEDIGKLPDVSIAENLARLPGLTAQRVDGRSQSISIRGMGPKYGVTLLNNREIVSTGDDRSVEYDQFPSELINSATVYKTPDASLSAMGLAGTVNMKTIRPLDVKGRRGNVSFRGEYADNGKLNSGTDDIGGRFSASYIDQFADNTIGIALGFAHLDNPGQEKYYKSWGWQDNSLYPNQGWCGGGSCVSPGLVAGQTAITGFERGVTSTDRQRDGLMGVLEWKPSDNFSSMVDLYYSKFDQKSIQSEEQAFLGGMWSNASYTNPVANAQGVITSATVSVPANTATLLSRYNKRKDETFAIGWNNELKYDKWKFGVDLSYSKAKRDEYNGQQVATLAAPLSYLVNASTTGISSFTPSANLADPNLMQLFAKWNAGSARAATPHIVDDMKAFRLTAERAFEDGVITNVSGGVSYTERSKDVKRAEEYYDLVGGPRVTLAPNVLTSGQPGVLAWDYQKALSAYYGPGYDAYSPHGTTYNGQPWLKVGRFWGVEEKVTTAFGKASFDVDMKIPVRGNVGVQYIHTNSHSTGNVWANNQVIPATGDHSYNDVLPSLNVVFDLGNVLSKGAMVRFGAAKEMARPPMESMRAGIDGSVGNLPPFLWTGKGGNPDLEPWRADAYDLSFEKYFGKRSYLAAAYFFKDLKNPIYNQKGPIDVSSLPAPANIPVGATPFPIGTVTAPANGTNSGFVRGYELSGSLDAGLFMPSLDGFGFTGSLSGTDSSIQERGANIYGDSFTTTSPLEGLSGIVRSMTAYYEHNGFSARISQRYRSSFTAIARDQFGDPSLTKIGSEKIVDLQLGYAFETGQLKGLSVLFQVNNLTDEAYKTSVSAVDNPSLVLPERYNKYGRQFLLGATYKFQ
ncbi:MAG: TonB-dependent receptor [Methylotenera sp.]|nr:TonB-dependent receptor [Methylotenera sp.]